MTQNVQQAAADTGEQELADSKHQASRGPVGRRAPCGGRWACASKAAFHSHVCCTPSGTATDAPAGSSTSTALQEKGEQEEGGAEAGHGGGGAAQQRKLDPPFALPEPPYIFWQDAVTLIVLGAIIGALGYG